MLKISLDIESYCDQELAADVQIGKAPIPAQSISVVLRVQVTKVVCKSALLKLFKVIAVTCRLNKILMDHSQTINSRKQINQT